MKLGNMKIKYKLIIISTAFLIPIFLLLYLFISEKNVAVSFAQKEINGNIILSKIMPLLDLTINFHRDSISGNREKNDNPQPLIFAINDAAETCAAIKKSGPNGVMDHETFFNDINNSFADYRKNGEQAYAAYYKSIRALYSQIGDVSNLILDPDLDSYYLMDITLLKTADALQNIDEVFKFISNKGASKTLTDREAVRITVLAGLITSNTEGMNYSFNAAFKNDSTKDKILKKNLQPYFDKYRLVSETVTAKLTETAERKKISPEESQIVADNCAIMKKNLVDLFNKSIQKQNALLKNRISKFRTALYSALSIVTIFLLLSLFIIVKVSRSINISFRDALGMTQKLSCGEINISEKVFTTDEIGRIKNSIYGFSRRINDVITQTLAVSADMNASSGNLSRALVNFYENSKEEAASIEELSATVEQITAGMESLSGSAEKQYQFQSKLNGKIGNHSAILETMRESVFSTKDFTGRLSHQAGNGKLQLENITQRIIKIKKSSSQMKSIAEIINDISEQINMLSLNASIEAARAGDAGRGFAIVAEEISKLADMTSASMKDINGLISQNDDETGNGMSEIQSNVEMFTQVMNGIQTISGLIDGIASDLHQQLEKNAALAEESNDVQKHYNHLKDAINEQMMAIETASQAVYGINEITQNNAATCDMLSDSAIKSKKMSDSLQDIISFFKV